MADDVLFVGREKELESFKRFITFENNQPIFYLYSGTDDPTQKGGLGKTWLLQKFIRLRDQYDDRTILWSDEVIDFYYVSNRFEIGMLHSMIGRISKATNDTTGANVLLSALDTYEKSLSTLLGLQAQFALKRDIQDKFILWAKDTISRTHSGRVLLFFDTFELVQDESSLIESLLWLLHNLRGNLKVVVAGRNRFDWEKAQANLITGELLSTFELPLGGLGPDEAVSFFERHGMGGIQPEEIEKISEVVSGRPILLALVIDLLREGILSVDSVAQIDKAAVSEYLALRILDPRFPPDNAIILAMAHIYHRCNGEILRYLQHEIGKDPREYSQIVQALARFSFVKYYESTQEFVLHDEMRDLITRFVWPQHDPVSRTRRALSKQMVDFYEGELNKKPIESRLRSAYLVEQLYHLLYASQEDGYNKFTNLFREARKVRNYSLCHALLVEVGKFKFEGTQTDQIELVATELDLQEYRIEEATRRYKSLADAFRKRKDEIPLAQALEGLGDCYAAKGELLQAIDYLGQALIIYQTHGSSSPMLWVTSRMAEVYASIGKYTVAEEYLTRAEYLSKALNDAGRNIDKRVLARAYTALGQVYRRHAQLDAALERFEAGLRLKNEIGEKWDLGLSYVGVGNVWRGSRHKGNDERWPSAVQNYRAALDISSQTEDLLSRVRALEDWGWLEWLMSSQASPTAAERERHLNEASRLAQESLGLCEKYGFYWDYAANYHTLLHVEVSRNNLPEEERLAKMLYESARKWPDGFMLHDGIMHLADVARKKKDYNEVHRLSSLMKELATQGYSFPYFIGQIMFIVGETELTMDNRDSAFDAFAESTGHMAEQPAGSGGLNPFPDQVTKLSGKLNALPIEQQEKYRNRILTYWKRTGLADRFRSEYNYLEERIGRAP